MINLKQKPHSREYLIHRYWGRKSADLVKYFIEEYTEQGDNVLDPFLGSGVSMVESCKLNRNSVGFDINPIATLLTEVTLMDVSESVLRKKYEEIVSSIPADLMELNYTFYRNKKYIVSAWSWENDTLKKVRFRDSEGKEFLKNASDKDRDILKKADVLAKKYRKDILIPSDEVIKFVRRGGVCLISDLFSPRNLLMIGFVTKKINDIKNENIRKPLQIVLTSSLTNASFMLPADVDKVVSKSGWQISKLWKPTRRIEKNVVDSLDKRLAILLSGKREIAGSVDIKRCRIFTQSAEDLSCVKTKSIDYVFTDPPYGDSISYLALGMFWNAFLDTSVRYKDEIIFDKNRGKGYVEYEEGLKKVFKEVYRVLKDGKYMTVTFNSRDLKFWKIIMDVIISSGFKFQQVNWFDQAVQSGTQGINKESTLRGDFTYTFQKGGVFDKNLKDVEGKGLIIEKTREAIDFYGGFVETYKLYNLLIPEIIEKRAFLDDGELMSIDAVLNENFECASVLEGEKMKYGYKK